MSENDQGSTCVFFLIFPLHLALPHLFCSNDNTVGRKGLVTSETLGAKNVVEVTEVRVKSDLHSTKSELLVAKSDLEHADGKLQTAKSDLEKAEGKLGTAEGKLQTAEGNLQRAKSEQQTAKSEQQKAKTDEETANKELQNAIARKVSSDEVEALRKRASHYEQLSQSCIAQVATCNAQVATCNAQVATCNALVDNCIAHIKSCTTQVEAWQQHVRYYLSQIQAHKNATADSTQKSKNGNELLTICASLLIVLYLH